MSQQELLKTVSQVLDQSGIEYMITGSMVSSLQGEPRSTHDIDLVVHLKKSAVQTLIKAFPMPDYYLEEDSILEAIDRDSMFNMMANNEGDKVDFWILTDKPFDQSRFARKYTEEIFGIPMYVSTPEDTILAKLRWANLSGGSEKQFTDALRIYEVQFEHLNQDYLKTWAEALGTTDLLARLQTEADIL
ncbi:MAG: hypothetical protein HOE48_15605 [Candidatus Latescibacteria bacterium]|jgi:hypothetical protein|nr:hypothetical protein [Candidatus Latescibacterota bacterium]MBT4139346.1 hypothetical protein [Candidatus Latescibacterota bacterium]